jgi:hypothetical protein
MDPVSAGIIRRVLPTLPKVTATAAINGERIAYTEGNIRPLMRMLTDVVRPKRHRPAFWRHQSEGAGAASVSSRVHPDLAKGSVSTAAATCWHDEEVIAVSRQTVSLLICLALMPETDVHICYSLRRDGTEKLAAYSI